MKISLREWVTISIWQPKFVMVQFYNIYLITRLQVRIKLITYK
jgi:hypothetical protein